jgi:hypothetical protein
MRVELTIKDDRQAVNKEIKRILETFVGVGHEDRYFVVEGDDRRALEAVFQTTIQDAKELVKKVQNMSIFGIGDATRPLTDGESIQLAEQAVFWGQTPAEFIKTTMDRVLDETLNRV